MGDKDLKKLEEKKRELELEIARLQDNIDSSIDTVREDIAQKLKPSELIKNYPLKSLGISIMAGFLLSGVLSGKKNNRNENGTLVGQELKRLLLNKSMSLVADYIDRIIASKREK